MARRKPARAFSSPSANNRRREKLQAGFGLPLRPAPERRSLAAPLSAQTLSVLAGLGDIDFVGGDVVEVSPPYDHADITAIAAATVTQHYLGLLAARARTT